MIENSSSDDLSKPINALARGIAILRYVQARDEPVGVIQIARDLTINASNCFNLLRTLARERLVVFDPAWRSVRQDHS